MSPGGRDDSASDEHTPLRTDIATPARVYDYLLGGKDNYSADREAAAQIFAAMGEEPALAVVRENREFLVRAVRYLVKEAGIRQIIDVGSGLPTQMNTHQVAHEIDPDVRVVYVDNDPIVLAHGRALLADNDRTRVLTADMRMPDEIIHQSGEMKAIDWSEPVAVLFIAVFHFIRDSEDPGGIVARFVDAAAPGSYVALTHLTKDGPRPEEVALIEATYDESVTSPMIFRSRAEIEGYFTGLDLVEPGELVRPWQWHKDPQSNTRTDWLYAGVGRKP